MTDGCQNISRPVCITTGYLFGCYGLPLWTILDFLIYLCYFVWFHPFNPPKYPMLGLISKNCLSRGESTLKVKGEVFIFGGDHKLGLTFIGNLSDPSTEIKMFLPSTPVYRCRGTSPPLSGG